MDKSNKFDLNEIIEKYRWWIGSFLFIAIILSGGFLLWRERGWSSKVEESKDVQILQLEEKIEDSTARIKQLEDRMASTPTQPAAEAKVQTGEIGAVAGATTSSQDKATVPSGKVNLNTATSAELDTLPGIGAAYAQRIIDYRQSKGGFKNISELKNIKGIGDKTFEKLKDLVTL